MVTVGNSGFSLSLCVSLTVEEAVSYASTGLPQVKTMHFNVHFFKNRFVRHLTYILHVLTLLYGGCRLTYLLHSFNPPLPSQTASCVTIRCQTDLFFFFLNTCWLLRWMSTFIPNIRHGVCFRKPHDAFWGLTASFRNTLHLLLTPNKPATFDPVIHGPSHKSQISSWGFTDCSFNHLISLMELTAPSVWSGWGVTVTSSTITGNNQWASGGITAITPPPPPPPPQAPVWWPELLWERHRQKSSSI